MIKYFLLVLCITNSFCGCFPEYVKPSYLTTICDTSLIPLSICENIKINQLEINDTYNSRLMNFYQMRKNANENRVITSSITLITGSLAGGFGAVDGNTNRTIAGISGGLSLFSGIIGLILKQPESEHNNEETIRSDYSNVALSQAAFNSVLSQILLLCKIEQRTPNDKETLNLQKALTDYQNAIGKFGINSNILTNELNSFMTLNLK